MRIRGNGEAEPQVSACELSIQPHDGSGRAEVWTGVMFTDCTILFFLTIHLITPWPVGSCPP